MPTLSSLLPRSGLSGRVVRASSGRERRKAKQDAHLPNGQPGPKPTKLNAIMLHTMAHPIDTGWMSHMDTCMACHTLASYVHVCSLSAGSSNHVDATATQQRRSSDSSHNNTAAKQQQQQQQQQHQQQLAAGRGTQQHDVEAQGKQQQRRESDAAIRNNGTDSSPDGALRSPNNPSQPPLSPHNNLYHTNNIPIISR